MAVQATCLCALLQPEPQVYDLFDDIMLLAEVHTQQSLQDCTKLGMHAMIY